MVEFKSNDVSTPVPGTFQGGFPVRIIYHENMGIDIPM